MRTTEIDFLRRRIAMERQLADQASCEVAASAHLRLLRLYEARLESEAATIVEISRPIDVRMATAIHMIA